MKLIPKFFSTKNNVAPGSRLAYRDMVIHTTVASVVKWLTVNFFIAVASFLDWLKLIGFHRWAFLLERLITIVMIFVLAAVFYLSVRKAIVSAFRFSQMDVHVLALDPMRLLRFLLALATMAGIAYLFHLILPNLPLS